MAKVREGLELTLKMLSIATGKFGLKEIDPQGEAFDPEYHQAITVQEAGDQSPRHRGHRRPEGLFAQRPADSPRHGDRDPVALRLGRERRLEKGRRGTKYQRCSRRNETGSRSLGAGEPGDPVGTAARTVQRRIQ